MTTESISEKSQLQKVESSTQLQQASNQYDQMLNLAIDKNADLDKLEKIMEMKERYEANEARKAYAEALSKFRGICPPITKDIHVQYGKTDYWHESLDGLIKTISPALSECGLVHTFGTGSENGIITVTCRITHKLGHSDETGLPSPPDTSGGKNSIQGIGSAITYLQRYTLKAMLGLSAGQDNDAITPEQVEQAEPMNLLQALMLATDSLGVYLLTDKVTGNKDQDQGISELMNMLTMPESYKLKGAMKENHTRMNKEGIAIFKAINEAVDEMDTQKMKECFEGSTLVSKNLLKENVGENVFNEITLLMKGDK